MAEALVSYFRQALPPELVEALHGRIQALEKGNFEQILNDPFAHRLLREEEGDGSLHGRFEGSSTWNEYILKRLGVVFARRQDSDGEVLEQTPLFRSHLLLIIGLASLYAFLQSTVTGPPLPFDPAKLLFPEPISSDSARVSSIRKALIISLSTDGEAAYRLTPHIELFCLADAIFNFPSVIRNVEGATWAKLRVGFTHQHLLSENAPSLQDAIYKHLVDVEAEIVRMKSGPETTAALLLERATINTYHGLDRKAREDLDEAVKLRQFQFALTGLLGKRTKFQEKDYSQLIVLACSEDSSTHNGSPENEAPANTPNTEKPKPENLDLNDDTLLERISFAETAVTSTDITSEASLPPALKSLDPSNQPLLHPLDSIILLSLASSIKNTSPEDGLTREETLPYATRVLEGGSSNWQIYTQALLVRSRIEGYRSRTIERGLLQLQALVDQVIAETTGVGTTNGDDAAAQATTFLPRPKQNESATVDERLRYVFPLASPSRWELEAELAQRWVSMGGLRSALEIYERLQMWAEVALCWAATEREDKATRIVRRQLFHPTNGGDDAAASDNDEEKWEGPARDPPPTDAPRLYCILGDIDQDPTMYEAAWEVSAHRYARAQRSLGKLYFAQKDYGASATAYAASLKVNQLHHPSWFALGCAYLELPDFDAAVHAFTRTVQLDAGDAEAWSNLAAALLSINRAEGKTGGDGGGPARQKRLKDALNALKQASKLQFGSYRILENLLTVAASTVPPSYVDVLSAQNRLIDLRGASEGEKCIDVDILELLVQHIIASAPGGFDPNLPGYERMTVEMVDKKVVPLITASARLWDVVGRLAVWRGKAVTALHAQEKGWRAVISQPGWEYGSEEAWNKVVDKTIDVVDAYGRFGPMESTEGLSGGTGAVVMKDWRFTARSSIRTIMGRGKASWEDTEGWDRLKAKLDGLKGT